MREELPKDKEKLQTVDRRPLQTVIQTLYRIYPQQITSPQNICCAMRTRHKIHIRILIGHASYKRVGSMGAPWEEHLQDVPMQACDAQLRTNHDVGSKLAEAACL